jgi:hypothetical protein
VYNPGSKHSTGFTSADNLHFTYISFSPSSQSEEPSFFRSKSAYQDAHVFCFERVGNMILAFQNELGYILDA